MRKGELLPPGTVRLATALSESVVRFNRGGGGVGGVTLRILKHVDFLAPMTVAMFLSHVPFQQ